MSRGRGVVVDKNKRLFNEVQIKHGILLSFETIFFFVIENQNVSVFGNDL